MNYRKLFVRVVFPISQSKLVPKFMEEQFLEGVRSLERQSFVSYITVVDKNGFSIATTGTANKSVAAYVREVHNCVQQIFPDSEDIKITIEGNEKCVIIGEKDGNLLGFQISKDAL